MDWRFTPLAIPLLIGAGLLWGVAAVAWRRRTAPGALALMWVGLLAPVYCIAYALEISSLDLNTVKLLLKIQYLGSPPVAGLLAVVIVAYLGYEINRRLLAFIFIMPLLTVVLAWTNDYHELIWRNLRLDTSGTFTRTLFERGVFYWVASLHFYGLVVLGLSVLMRAYAQQQGLFRRQVLSLILTLATVAITHLFYVAGFFADGFDINPYTLLFVAVVFMLVLLRYDLYRVMPIAQEQLLTRLQSPVAVVDPNDRVIYLNRAGEALAGVSLADAAGQPLGATVPRMAALLGANGAPSPEIAWETGDTTRWFDANVSPLMDERGALRGRMLLLNEITARKESELALRRANELINQLRLFESDITSSLRVQTVVQLTLDAALRIVAAEGVWLGLLEPGGLRVVGQLGPYPPSLGAGRLYPIAPVKNALETGRTVRLTVDDITAQDDALPHLPTTEQMLVIGLLRGQQKPLGVLVLEIGAAGLLDDTVFDGVQLLARQVANALDKAQLYEAQTDLVRELEAFSHTVAHDLKNPIGAVVSYAELALEDLDSPQLDRFLSRIHWSGAKALKIIESLMMLAGINRQERIELAPLDMSAIVAQALERYDEHITDSNAQVVQPATWATATGYGPWVEEIWANYVSNALKYGGKPPHITLGYDTPDAETVRFWVRDNGAGLTEAQISTLFQPFTRLPETQRLAEGHGLGLSIVERIANRLRGTAGVESKPGEGSTFFFTLPVQDNI